MIEDEITKHISTGISINQHSVHEPKFLPMLIKWVERLWPFQAIMFAPSYKSIVLKPALCAWNAFKDMFKRQELSALEWTDSIIIATGCAL